MQIPAKPHICWEITTEYDNIEHSSPHTFTSEECHLTYGCSAQSSTYEFIRYRSLFEVLGDPALYVRFLRPVIATRDVKSGHRPTGRILSRQPACGAEQAGVHHSPLSLHRFHKRIALMEFSDVHEVFGRINLAKGE
jgi:hypothetical protein